MDLTRYVFGSFIPGRSPFMAFGIQAIDILSPEYDIHKRCVRALSKIYGLLPDSHKIKSTLMTSQHAIASGGFSDIWKAANEKNEVFATKVLRTYENNASQVTKVRQYARFPLPPDEGF